LRDRAWPVPSASAGQ